MSRKGRWVALNTVAVLTTAGCGDGGPDARRSSPEADFAPDFAHARAFSSQTLAAKVLNGTPAASWIGDEDRFWVRIQSEGGHRFVIVDAATGDRSPAFDHDALASALRAAGEAEAHPDSLKIVAMELASTAIQVQLAGGSYVCDPARGSCEGRGPLIDPYSVRSPDGARSAFVRDHNLWLRAAATGDETQLTRGGTAGYAYGDPEIFDTGRVGRRRTGNPKAVLGDAWSPDGRYVAAVRTDKRVFPLRPQVVEYVPPDGNFSVVHMDYHGVAADHIVPPRTVEIIDTQTGRITVADIPHEQLQDYVARHLVDGSVWWSPALGSFYFDAGTRDGRTYRLFEVDIETGAARTVVEETEDYYYAYNPNDYAPPNFHVTSDGAEAIWYSQRTGYGHLYLYDARSGALKNPITEGEWVVFDLLVVDEAARTVYFTAGGREQGRNPYFRHLYRVGFDGGEPLLLTPEDANHEFTADLTANANILGSPTSRISPSGRYFFDVHSTIDQPPVMVVRSIEGTLVSTVLEADATALYATGWRPPERFVAKAADGETDLYGLLYTPTEMVPGMKYAVVEQTYPGPQGDFAPHGFMHAIAGFPANDMQKTAELGFVGVVMDGRGTSRRGHAFRYAFSGTEDVYGSVDHKVTIEQLAERHDFIDADRVGITGGSFGGYGTVRATLLHPEFFDVVVSYVGPHDMRYMASALTIDRFFGIPGEKGSADDPYTRISNTHIVDRLLGHLLLIYGEIDENVPFNNAMIMYDALIAADKDFDTLILPNTPHGASAHPYAQRRQLEYFVEHLGGPVPIG